MRLSAVFLVLVAITGCSSVDRPANNAPSPGQWQPPPNAPYATNAPPLEPQQAPAPSPWMAPAPSAWPTSVPLLPVPIAWSGGWPTIPGLPTWSGQPQPQPTPALSAQAPSGDVAQRCVDDINGYRATKGLAPLARWVEAEPCASAEAAEDSRSQRAHGSFGRCREASQNACPNWPGPPERMIDDCLKMMWGEGPGEFSRHGHYMNMVDTRATKVACGVTTMANGSLWAVQDFQ